MNRKQLIAALKDGAEVLESTSSLSDIDFAAEFASVLGVQGMNLSVFLRAFQASGDSGDFLRQAADQMRPVTAYTAECVYCLRQVDQRRLEVES